MTILEIFAKIGPTIATIGAVYLAYIFARRQRLFENRNEEYKKVRCVISNLIQIWRELSMVEHYIFSDDNYSDLLFMDAKVTSDFFEIDIKRIQSLKELLNQSKEDIKQINVKLFYILESQFSEFHKILDILNSYLNINSKEIDFKKTLKGLYKDHVKDLEYIISETGKNLPKKEQKGISELIADHNKELNQINVNNEIPQFLINLLNKHTPLKSPITSEELTYFYNDTTVKVIVSKLIPVLRTLIDYSKPVNLLRDIHRLFSEESFIKDIDDDFLLKIELSEKENELFRNNLGFYKLVCGVYKKFDSKIPIEFKRALIQINNGTIDIKNELEKGKKQQEMINASA